MAETVRYCCVCSSGLVDNSELSQPASRAKYTIICNCELYFERSNKTARMRTLGSETEGANSRNLRSFQWLDNVDRCTFQFFNVNTFER